MRCAARGVSWVVEPVRGGGLGVLQMRMAAVSVLPLMPRPAVIVSLGLLVGCLSLGISIQSLVSAIGLFCVALVVDIYMYLIDMCIFIHVHINSYTYMYIYIYIYICIYVYMYTCVYVYVYMGMCLYIYKCVCICLYMYVCVCLYVYVCV